MKLFLILSLIPITLFPKANSIFIDFDSSMSVSKFYSHEKSKMIQKDSTWILAKNLYEKYLLNNDKSLEKLRIPKIIHQIWLGSPFPEKYESWQNSWKNNHPDWEYKLWTDKDILELNLVNKQTYDMSTNYGAKSDIARYEILYRYGGLYIDTDFECLKSFDVLHHSCDFYVGIFFDNYNFCLANGIIGTVPEHPLMKECINSIKKPKTNKEQGYDIFTRTGPFLLTHCYKKIVSLEEDTKTTIIAMPASYFFPWDYNYPGPGNQYIKPESMAIHHYECSWAK